MDPYLTEALTRWSVRIAVGFYLTRVFFDLRSVGNSPQARFARIARWAWTAGVSFYVLHVICAFAFYHEWSHHLAYQHTAEQTAAVVGIHWGGGLYFNYAFTLFWLADVILWWCRDVESPYRSPAYFWTVHLVFAFMVLNATVVFGPPLWKWVALVVVFVFLFAYLARHR